MQRAIAESSVASRAGEDLDRRREGLERNGFAWARQFAPSGLVSSLSAAMERMSTDADRAGVRDVLRRSPEAKAFAQSREVSELLAPFFGRPPLAVRGIFFNKTAKANWRVAWHQDLTIAVCEQRDVAGFGPWSHKEGVLHVQPPATVLERMLAIRLHLDDCDESNGPLRVLPGSHCEGKLADGQIEHWKQRQAEVTCTARAGDALLLRPLLLHASSPAMTPARRRILHLEFAADPLPGGLRWFEEPQILASP